MDNLDYHVLRRIFANLQTNELVRMAAMNEHYRAQAESVIRLRYRHRTLAVSSVSNAALATLRFFGACVNSVAFFEQRFGPTLSAVLANCGEALVEITFVDLTITDLIVQSLLEMPRTITTLVITVCWFDSKLASARFFSKFSSLRELQISSNFEYGINTLSFAGQYRFPHLSSVAIYNDVNITTRTIRTLLRKCATLTTFKIHRCSGVRGQLLADIADNTPFIEILSIVGCWHVVTQVTEIRRLRMLQYLEFDANSQSITAMLNAVVGANLPIQTLSLLNFVMEPRLCIAIGRLSLLHTLTLEFANVPEDDPDDPDEPNRYFIPEVLLMVSNLTHLEIEVDNLQNVRDVVGRAASLQTLHFNLNRNVEVAEIDAAFFNRIVATVQQRRSNLRLDIIGNHPHLQLSVPLEVQQRNAHIVRFEI